MIFTGRNEVVAKVMFLHVCVILFTGGGCSPCRGGLPGDTPPAGRTPPRQGEPPPGRENPPSKENPPRQGEPPRREEDCSIRSMSGR